MIVRLKTANFIPLKGWVGYIFIIFFRKGKWKLIILDVNIVIHFENTYINVLIHVEKTLFRSRDFAGLPNPRNHVKSE